jgi:hypothetical protein
MKKLKYSFPEYHKFYICNTCEGHGKHSNYLGVISNEWREDKDFMEDYLNGYYDKLCNDCDGTGKVMYPNVKSAPYKIRRQWVKERQIIQEEQYLESYYERRLQWQDAGGYGDFY